MKERFASGYNDFVLPFMLSMIFILVYLLVAIIRVIIQLPPKDRKRYLLSLINPVILVKDIKDIICDVLLHVKIWKRKPLLGYMHSSIAFGWFMIILIGHIETFLYVPERAGLLYYPIFFRFFMMETNHTLQGALLFFLMDFFLLVILSGIALAMFKRIRSRALGMRRTTRTTLPDKIAMYALWAIFPLRLLAEGFTAGISGGSFLTKSVWLLFSNFLSNDYHILPTWWAYSIALGTFFFCLPFTRYMHIPTEIFFITLKNAGIKSWHPRKGYALAEIYSCSSCGMCIDACPMNAQKKNLKYSSVYFIRFLRRRNRRKMEEIADKCLQCGKCVAVCPVEVDSCRLKLLSRERHRDGKIKADYTYLQRVNTVEPAEKRPKVLYYAGCMSQLTPSIGKAMGSLLDKASVEWSPMDKDGGICCGRPLILSGRREEAQAMIQRNTELILASGADTLLVTCPICFKVFREEYNLPGIRVVHHSQYLNELVKSGALKVEKEDTRMVYHDPCELGRGCGIYEEPRELLSKVCELVPAGHERDESICCGGSVGSITLSHEERVHITDAAVEDLMTNHPQEIVTACPLCLKTFSPRSAKKVRDLAEVIDRCSTSPEK
ncbi:MAG: (Fe-S)-binding protein [Bacteroidales bacterium]|nr:(Fe-S)-binding protein [Bacteroidales bacterium]